MGIHFILVEPAVPENIGSAARAIKTMGFTSLRLVNPCNHLSPEAKWLAHGSNDILENSQVFKNLDEALYDIDFVIASSAKTRSTKIDYIIADDLPSLILNKADTITNIGILFGREESGLKNSELKLAHITSFIQMQQPYPSLNLSQAVMLYAYILSKVNYTLQQKSTHIINDASFLTLTNKVKEILISTDIDKNKNLSSRIMERLALLESGDINLLHSITHKLLEKLK